MVGMEEMWQLRRPVESASSGLLVDFEWLLTTVKGLTCSSSLHKNILMDVGLATVRTIPKRVEASIDWRLRTQMLAWSKKKLFWCAWRFWRWTNFRALMSFYSFESSRNNCKIKGVLGLQDWTWNLLCSQSLSKSLPQRSVENLLRHLSVCWCQQTIVCFHWNFTHKVMQQTALSSQGWLSVKYRALGDLASCLFFCSNHPGKQGYFLVSRTLLWWLPSNTMYYS
jgi:hypothetical protein